MFYVSMKSCMFEMSVRAVAERSSFNQSEINQQVTLNNITTSFRSKTKLKKFIAGTGVHRAIMPTMCAMSFQSRSIGNGLNIIYTRSGPFVVENNFDGRSNREFNGNGTLGNTYYLIIIRYACLCNRYTSTYQ